MSEAKRIVATRRRMERVRISAIRLPRLVMFVALAVFPLIASAGVTGHVVAGAGLHEKAANKKVGTSVSAKPGSCLVSLSSVKKLQAQEEINFIDVRSPAEYGHYRIPGSINIPLYQVKTKEFLKASFVVLVNDGRDTVGLEKACGELRRSGFKNVSVLDGGLFAWHAGKAPMEGDPLEMAKLNHMSADELFEVRSEKNWAVIVVSAQKLNKDIRSWLPNTVITFSPGSIAGISSSIRRLKRANPKVKLLIIADKDGTYGRIEAQLKKSGLASDVFRLDGCVDGYREHVANQRAVWKQQSLPRRYEICPG